MITKEELIQFIGEKTPFAEGALFSEDFIDWLVIYINHRHITPEKLIECIKKDRGIVTHNPRVDNERRLDKLKKVKMDMAKRAKKERLDYLEERLIKIELHLGI
jgi:hypothetical protein